MDFMDKVTLDDLDGDQREIAELIGLEAYKLLVRRYGGSGRIYIKKPETIVREIRDKCIRQEYTGYNMDELIHKYRMSESSIRKILNSSAYKRVPGHVPGQIFLFDKQKSTEKF